jgi:hypothetical protein
MSTVTLTQLNPALKTAYPDKPIPNYRQLYFAILDGRIPAEQVGGRYKVDVTAAAKALGLVELAAA